ncbi:hypothetical protein MOX02_24860 [Methylobacterium oxalidis]|uniref:Uncharacterized protein n=2 Tax=Methylobacterium oxalidis TaxID=944322 RepID=A0A512J395_9HYPH|nr:hypothetical protein MOX02_24860 [Methylobacterium oxalidis]GLS62820.1 hypothetical protein GCM10007888_12010 [Methylobacterium oxalidis]
MQFVGAHRDECAACWLWTGSFTAPRRRYKAYRIPEDYEGRRNIAGCFQQERGMPTIRIPEKGYAVSAVRHVYAELKCIGYDEVPRLSRCLDERCVNPHHTLELDVSPFEIRKRAAEVKGIVFEAVSAAEVMEILQRIRPATWANFATAESECELPSGSITDAIWREYVLWDDANPDLD